MSNTKNRYCSGTNRKHIWKEDFFEELKEGDTFQSFTCSNCQAELSIQYYPKGMNPVPIDYDYGASLIINGETVHSLKFVQPVSKDEATALFRGSVWESEMAKYEYVIDLCCKKEAACVDTEQLGYSYS